MDGPRPTLRRRSARTAPLSFGQERLWLIDAAEPGGASHNVPLLLPWRERVDPKAWERALAAVAARHEALRTSYQLVDGVPRQVVGDPEPVPLTVAEPAAEPTGQELARSARTPFDFTAGPPLRCVLWRGPERDTVLLTIHHIAIDGWSLAPLFRDLADAYTAALDGVDPVRGEPPLQYADFAAWEREAARESAWRQRTEQRAAVLAGSASHLRLAGYRAGDPAGGGRPETRPGAEHAFPIPPALWDGVRDLAGQLRVTPFVVLLAAYQEVLRRWSGRDDFLIGTVMANRPHSTLEEVVGFFANTVPVCCRPCPEQTFAQLCQQVRQEVYQALSWQGIPYHHLSARVTALRGQGRTPLVAAGFTLQNMPAPELSGPDRWEPPRLLPSGAARFDLMLLVEERGGQATGTVEYDAGCYPAPVVAGLAGGLLVLLEAAVAAPATRVAALPLTRRPAGAHSPGVLVGPRVDYPATILDPVDRRLGAEPDAPAVTGPEGTLTRGELDRWADQVATGLAAAGTEPGEVVPVLARRGGGLVAGWLGTLRSGAGFAALGLDTPPDRLRSILEHIGARVAVADPAGAALLRELGRTPQVVALDRAGGAVAGAARPAYRPGGADLAVVFHTSGTTGQPKGVAVPHRGLANSALWWATDAGLGRSDRVLCVVGTGFDPCTFEVFRCLAAGSELVFADDVQRRDGRALWRLLSGATVAALTPSLLRAVLDAAAAGPPPERLRLLYLGGEPLSRRLATHLAGWPGVAVRNLYGPTEAACNATSSDVDLAGTDDPAIGRPIANTRAYLLGAAGEELPAGAVGELYLAGAGVAAGYLGRPAETAAAFLPDAFPDPATPAARMYRTGDLAAIRADGQMEFRGRADGQVKLLGNRVELDEVRRLIERHPGVSAVAAEVVGDPARLSAYVVLAPGADPTREELVEPLRRWLPAGALPAAVRVVAAIPVTDHGKVDFPALRIAAGRALRAGGPEPGSLTPEQAWAADRFAAALMLAPEARAGMAAGTDFFQLGGHSLLAVQMLAEAESGGGTPLSLREFLADPTVAGLAAQRAAVGGTRPAVGGTRPAASGQTGPHPASPAQQDFYFLDRLPGLRAACLAPSIVELTGPVDHRALCRAVRLVLGRHPALRSRFGIDHTSRQVVYRTGGTAPDCQFVDARGWDPEVLREHLAAACRAPFDLRGEPPVRAEVVTVGGDRTLLVVTTHHIAADGWSHGVVMDEIGEVYRTGTDANLPPPVHPADLQDRWRELPEPRRQADLAAVIRRLAGVPTDIDLPYARPRVGPQRTEGASCRESLPAGTTAGLRRLLSRTGCTLPMVSAALMAVGLARWAPQRRFLFAYPWSGRDSADRLRAVGMLLNTGLLRVDLEPVPTWRELLRAVRAESLASYRGGHVPFDAVAAALQPGRDLTRPRLTPVVLNSATGSGGLDAGPGVAVRPLPVPELRVKYELELTMVDGPGGIELSLAYATARFDRSTAAGLLAGLVAVARELVHAPDRPTLEATHD
jgi:amino acid adenylation domain-containing protein